MISIRDAVRVARDSVWVDGAEQIGVIDFGTEPRLLTRLGEEIRSFPIGDRIYY